MLVIISEKPAAKITPNPHPTLVTGDKLTLKCTVSESTAEIKWNRNGAPVTPRARISQNGDNSTLVIEKVETDDSGGYSCVAHNRAGSGSSTVEIKVRGKMAFVVVISYGNCSVTCINWSVVLYQHQLTSINTTQLTLPEANRGELISKPNGVFCIITSFST